MSASEPSRGTRPISQTNQLLKGRTGSAEIVVSDDAQPEPSDTSPPLALREHLVWIVPAAALVISYALANLVMPLVRLSAWLDFYVVQPLIWIIPGAAGIVLGYRKRLKDLIPRSPILITGLLLGGVQVAAMVLTGLIAEFGRSPYSHQLLPMIGNTLRFLLILASMEIVRGCIIEKSGPHRRLLFVGLAVVLFGFITLPYSRLGNLTEGARSAVRFTGEFILPSLSESMLATYLVLLGGPLASMAYRGPILAFHWLSPILPNPSWIVSTFVNTLIPIVSLIMAYEMHLPDEQRLTEKRESKGQANWLLIGVVALVMVWFNNGAFGFQPTLLSGPSMQPAIYAGDLVIVRKVPADEIAVGDIIKFSQPGRNVVHRVKEIDRAENNTLIFITQGDNVNAPDPPVLEEYYIGKVIVIIPKIGYISIWLREALGALQ